jgi:superfamily II DNA or RNA helicase
MIVGTIDMMGRGIDIPEIDTVFLFAPVKFE